MFTHYLKIAFRSLMKFKSYTIINLTGLALGLSAGVLIMVYVLDELSYDKFHLNGKRLYRINTVFNDNSGQDSHNETNAWPIGDILRREFPEVESVLYTTNARNMTVSFEGKKLNEDTHYASPEFFFMFSFPILKGDAKSCLINPFSVVISREMEAKYFKQESALGKTMIFNDTLQFQVTGVMENIPSNSHMQLDMLMSFSTHEKTDKDFSYTSGWGNINMRNYVMLKEGVDLNAFKAKAGNLYMEKAGDMMKEFGMQAAVEFEPFEEIYLKSKSGNGMGPLGSITTVYLISGVGLFVILLACINFINMATARSVHRAKEVGIKKVVGSTRSLLITQFLSESFIITILSFVIALAAIGLFLPLFNQLLSKNYLITSLLDFKIVGGILILLTFITLCSGFYPAWVMSAFKPAEIFKGKMQSGSRGVQLRRVLVIFQFLISVSLVAGTLVVINQLNFMQSSDLGFTRDEVFVMNVARTKPVDGNAYTAFANELKSQTIVKDMTFCSALPAVSGWRGQWAFPEGGAADDHVDMQYIAADEKYISTLGLTLVAGRNFDPNRKADEDALIINENAARAMGWETANNAIGKKITSPSQHPAGTVIGVVKDYHDWGLQNNIVPSAIDFKPDYSYLYAVRYTAADTKVLVETLGGLWKKYFPENEFNYFFLSDTFSKQYEREQRMANVFSIFSVITILIAVIGLFGLVSFLVTTKTKELGVRKVMGASVWSLVSLLSKEFIVLVLVANVISIPNVIYFAQQWLQGFAFRMELSPMIFALTVFIALAITIIAVSIQTIKAAMSNPIKSLRYE